MAEKEQEEKGAGDEGWRWLLLKLGLKHATSISPPAP